MSIQVPQLCLEPPRTKPVPRSTWASTVKPGPGSQKFRTRTNVVHERAAVARAHLHGSCRRQSAGLHSTLGSRSLGHRYSTAWTAWVRGSNEVTGTRTRRGARLGTVHVLCKHLLHDTVQRHGYHGWRLEVIGLVVVGKFPAPARESSETIRRHTRPARGGGVRTSQSPQTECPHRPAPWCNNPVTTHAVNPAPSCTAPKKSARWRHVKPRGRPLRNRIRRYLDGL